MNCKGMRIIAPRCRQGRAGPHDSRSDEGSCPRPAGTSRYGVPTHAYESARPLPSGD